MVCTFIEIKPNTKIETYKYTCLSKYYFYEYKKKNTYFVYFYVFIFLIKKVNFDLPTKKTY